MPVSGVLLCNRKECPGGYWPFSVCRNQVSPGFLLLAALSFKDILKSVSPLTTGSLLGIFLCIGYSFQTLGLKYTTSSNAGFITGVSVVLVPLIYALINKKKPGLITSLTVIMAALGLFFISFPSGSFRLNYGDMLVLICAFGFAMHIITVDLYSHKHNAVAITAVQILFVGLVCSIIGLIVEPFPPYLTYNALSANRSLRYSPGFLVQNYMQGSVLPLDLRLF